MFKFKTHSTLHINGKVCTNISFIDFSKSNNLILVIFKQKILKCDINYIFIVFYYRLNSFVGNIIPLKFAIMTDQHTRRNYLIKNNLKE